MQQSDPFDLDAIRAREHDLPVLSCVLLERPPRHRPAESFLRGPIPWPWLVAAGRLSGRALQVALLLWKEAGCRRARTVSFCLTHGAEMGMSEDTARRALRRLAGAGLVSVRSLPGRCPEVTLLDMPRQAPAP
jgi:hypothetical protein